MSAKRLLADLIASAYQAFNSLTPDEQRAHRREQMISWVWGQCALSGSKIGKQRVAEIVDEYLDNDGSLQVKL